mmetsp:Transcript_48763/g.114464  ORF Transcript_48763/g.114464 Transcript_48763/m.114464 type:complete len:196 (-) Transcript_48763:116-703(-)
MRILTRVPNSVLWFLDYIPDASATIRRETEAFFKAGYLGGYGHRRVVFTKLLPREYEMLAKGQWADLALDTPHFNGHTTAVETMWAGVPLLTAPLSDRMHGRLATAMIASAGRNEPGGGHRDGRSLLEHVLIARDLDDYEEIAVKLACGHHVAGRANPGCYTPASLGVLEQLRRHLAAGVLTIMTSSRARHVMTR